MGDLFERPNPTPLLIAESIRHFNEVDKQIARSFWLVGNHDRPSRGEHHALLPLVEVGAKVVAEPDTWELDDGVVILTLPYVTDWMARQRGFESAQVWLDEYAKDTVEGLEDGERLYVVGHLDVYGSEHSDERDIGLHVPTALLESAEHIWLGHVHKHQSVGGNVTIVGSAIVANFGEADEVKGIVEVEL